MGKSIQKVMTQGVRELGLPQSVVENLFQKAEEHMSSKHVVFQPNGTTVAVRDGDGKKLDKLPITLPEKLWIIFDDYGNRWVATLLLPRDY